MTYFCVNNEIVVTMVIEFVQLYISLHTKLADLPGFTQEIKRS